MPFQVRMTLDLTNRGIVGRAHDNTEDIDTVVKEVSSIVFQMAGIQLGARQYSMVKNRLTSRLAKLKIESFGEYLKYLRHHRESESQTLLSLMTTHHSYFFREFSHFEYLINNGFHRLIEVARRRTDKTIRIWSAACSRGQEVYSLAMFFDYHLKNIAPDVEFEIWGTDVDSESIRLAQNGVYRNDEISQSPAMYVRNHWIRGKKNVREYSKLRDHLKSRCHFEVCNLLKPDIFLQGKEFDLIFCRNVFIYFDNSQVKRISEKLLQHLNRDGILVLGISETISGLDLPCEHIGPSVFQHPGAGKNIEAPRPPLSVPAQVLDILCVDDSDTIHTLLGRILTPDQGFRIKANAKDGRQALEILRTQKFDAITLDLHMPEMDGLEFLQQYGAKDTPVVVLSAINRDDPTIAQKALNSGAADYMEKPSLENLSQAGNEIRSKIKMVIAQEKAKLKSIRPASETPLATKKKIKVLIVDDSQTARLALTEILSRDPDLEVVGAAALPSQVEEMIRRYRPQVITLDINMPEMDGVELLQRLHPLYRIPTVLISSLSPEDGPKVIRALEAGAVDYIQKPQVTRPGDAQGICERVKIASAANLSTKAVISKNVAAFSPEAIRKNLIVMGASTGGTDALRIILESLPSEIPPIMIVQHIPPVYSAAFAHRLNEMLPFEVKEAAEGDIIKPNQVLIAPGGRQMAVQTVDDRLVVQINDDAPVNRHRPSVDYFFRSVAQTNHDHVIAVLLTGMGSDGASEMKTLRAQGARTIAQDKASSVVYGMPREAIDRGAAEFTLHLSDIASKICLLCENELHSRKSA